jgi:hypothetical protein
VFFTVMPFSSAYLTSMLSTTDAAADDELELAALGTRRCGWRGPWWLGADDDYVEVAQGLAQLFGLIELLNNLVAVVAQLLHCGHPCRQ